MKLIFLDIDGVLNDDDFWKERHKEMEAVAEKGSYFDFHVSMINPEKVKLLNQITDKTGANIVISSSWRNTKDLFAILKTAGVTGNLIAMTPYIFLECDTPGYEKVNGSHVVRGVEIHKYIDKHFDWEENYHGEPDGTWKPKRKGLESYIIFDDDGDMLYWQRNNFIQTNTYKGLQEADVKQAIKILNGEQ